MSEAEPINAEKVIKAQTQAFAGQTKYSFPVDQSWKRVLSVVDIDSNPPLILRHHVDMPNQKLYLEEVPDHSFTIEATVELV